MSEPRACICEWLKSLSDEDVISAMGCFTKEYQKRWPGTVHTFTEDELQNADGVVTRIAESQAAMPESMRGKKQ